MEIIVFSKPNCSLCEMAIEVLKDLQEMYPITIKEIDIYTDDKLIEEYGIRIPVLMEKETLIDEGIVERSTIESFLQTKY